MTKAPKNWREIGYLLPEVIDPEENICICVPIPKDWGHIRAFLGQLTELSKWLTWEKDGTDSGARAARRWFEIAECVAKEIDCIMSDDCGCSDPKPTNTRINPETGLYEVSHDGGITWEADPGNDIRSSGTIFPGTPGDPGATKRCEAANSVVGFLETLQQQELANLEANANVADIITGLIGSLSGIGLIFAFVPAAISMLVAFVVNKFAHMIAGDFESQFSSTTWDELLCILYCNMENDGSFTVDQWQTIKDQSVEEVTGYAGYWLQDHINLIGQVGLTNAARASYPGTRDCESCDCNEWCYIFDFAEGQQGWVSDTQYGAVGSFSADAWHGGTTTGAPDGDYYSTPCQITFTGNLLHVRIRGESANLAAVDLGCRISTGSDVTASIPGGDFDHSFDVEGDGLMTLHIWANCQNPNDTVITTVHLSGLNENPFGEDNCPE